MVAGILQTMKWFSPRIGGIVYTVHQSSGWFGLLFGMIHGLVLLFDKQVGYTLIEISIPFTSHYKPFESGLGILAFYAMFLLVVSSYLHEASWEEAVEKHLLSAFLSIYKYF